MAFRGYNALVVCFVSNPAHRLLAIHQLLILIHAHQMAAAIEVVSSHKILSVKIIVYKIVEILIRNLPSV